VAEIDAKVGGYGIVPFDLDSSVVSNHYFLYEVDQSIIDIQFFKYWLQTPSPLKQIRHFIRGALNYAAIRPHHFLELLIPLPTMSEQQRIVKKVDQLAIRIREAIVLEREIHLEQSILLQNYYRYSLQTGATRIQLRECLEQNSAPVIISDDKEYKQVKVSLNFKGVSLRQILPGIKIKTKKQYLACAGDLIFSRIDARNGAFGFIPAQLNGAIVSGDFPCFQVEESIVNKDVLGIVLKTSEFMQSVIDASRGVTNRRRLKEDKLLSIYIDIPKEEDQRKISLLCSKISAARKIQYQITYDRSQFIPALLDRAFGGDL
jgi:type I restriction enzyme, S subunit